MGSPKKLPPFNGFRWNPASGGGRHFGGAWDSLRVEGFVELERKVTGSLGISFACQFFGNDLPRSIGNVLAIWHVSPWGPHVRPDNSEHYTGHRAFCNSVPNIGTDSQRGRRLVD